MAYRQTATVIGYSPLQVTWLGSHCGTCTEGAEQLVTPQPHDVPLAQHTTPGPGLHDGKEKAVPHAHSQGVLLDPVLAEHPQVTHSHSVVPLGHPVEAQQTPAPNMAGVHAVLFAGCPA